MRKIKKHENCKRRIIKAKEEMIRAKERMIRVY
jgi:hypothetical protein